MVDGVELTGVDLKVALWTRRLFPPIYDAALWWGERRGMNDLRRRLASQATGRVLEIGAGTGLNLPHYPPSLDELVLSEPEPAMARRLQARANRAGRQARVVVTGAEQLPFPDACFDTVLCTLVLCTVQDPVQTLSEVRRVLAAGGRLLFLEHVRAEPGTSLERWQQRLHNPWHVLAAGCHDNRDTLEMLQAGSFAVEELRHERWRGMVPIVAPLITGVARVA